MNYLPCQYLSFKEFVEKFGQKTEATSNIKTKEILNEINISCGIYMISLPLLLEL